MDPIRSIAMIAGSGMRAQGQRLQITAENVANAASTGASPEEDPYRRKTVTFEESLDRASGASMVEVTDIGRDKSEFPVRYEPSHPAADEKGYVRMPNVNPILEMSNMREASRSYEANINMFESAQRMRRQLIDLLK